MFEILNGKDTKDYCNRVEPSVKGGMKLGKLFWETIKKELVKIHAKDNN